MKTERFGGKQGRVRLGVSLTTHVWAWAWEGGGVTSPLDFKIWHFAEKCFSLSFQLVN